MKKTQTKPKHELLTVGFRVNQVKVLELFGIKTIEDACWKSDDVLLRIPSIGPKTLAKFRSATRMYLVGKTLMDFYGPDYSEALDHATPAG